MNELSSQNDERRRGESKVAGDDDPRGSRSGNEKVGAKKKRKWGQWSLLTLMFLALSVSLFVLPFIHRAEHVRFWQKIQDSKFAEIEMTNGRPASLAKTLKLPSLLKYLFPDVADKYFDCVESIYIQEPNEELQSGISKHLGRCNNLVHLHWQGEVNNGMARDLAGCTSLAFAKMNNCQNTDKLLSSYVRLKNLEVVSFNQCSISKHGFEKLEQMSQLKLILLFETEISTDQLSRLRKKLPNCYVFAFAKSDLE